MDERIRAIMAEALRLPTDRIDADAAIGTVPNWDSTAHMRMMIALEDAFGIDLDESRMVEMTSFPRIRSVVEELRSAQSRAQSPEGMLRYGLEAVEHGRDDVVRLRQHPVF